MFCKFCGETMDPSQVKCRKCGHDASAASKCGGYHDVIKDLNKRGITDPSNPPQVYVTQKAPESKGWIAIGICALLVIISILIMLSVSNKLDAIKASIDDIDHCTCGVIEEETEPEKTDEVTEEQEASNKEEKDEKKDSEKTGQDFVEGLIDGVTNTDAEAPAKTESASCPYCKGGVDQNGKCTNENCESNK